MRILTAAALIVLVLAGCGRGEDPTAAPGTAATEPATPEPTAPADDPADDPAPDEQPAEPEEGGEAGDPSAADGFGTIDVTSGDFPSGGGEVALLVDVRTGVHDGFDRIVLEFSGDDVPSYRVRYVDPPVREDGSGNEVEVAGSAFLEMHLAPAAGVDMSGDGEEFEQTYTGPTRFTPDAQVVRELVRTGDFEANLTWVAGIDRKAGFDVSVLTSPLRLVVDVAHD
jgi:hypothetical protein